jgi:chromosome segregation ATPase
MDAAVLAPLAGLVGVLAGVLVTLWRGRHDVSTADRAQRWVELRETLARQDAEIARLDARADHLAELVVESRTQYLEERSRSGEARMVAAEERRKREECERERDHLSVRVAALEAEVGRLRDEADRLHRIVTEAAQDLRELRDRIRLCLVHCDHRPACGLVHVQ